LGFDAVDEPFTKQIKLLFAGLNQKSASDSFPKVGALAALLSPRVSKDTKDITVSPKEITLFATGAVEMWLRAVHSFLISASLTEASPIWASVAGYYASHYSIRGLAHLLGVFQLYKKKCILCLQTDAKHCVCHIERKNANGREHKYYWKYVSEHPSFINDPFFYPNRDDLPESDGAHRNKANYIDHLDRFPTFKPLSLDAMTDRIERVAGIPFSDVPIPNADKFPDIENVQIIAYHRIVKFRQCVDDALGQDNRFWRVHRRPSWCPDSMTFNVTEPVYLALYAQKT
jgi:hypothetical protein